MAAAKAMSLSRPSTSVSSTVRPPRSRNFGSPAARPWARWVTRKVQKISPCLPGLVLVSVARSASASVASPVMRAMSPRAALDGASLRARSVPGKTASTRLPPPPPPAPPAAADGKPVQARDQHGIKIGERGRGREHVSEWACEFQTDGDLTG